MKLLRYGNPGHEQPGVLDSEGNARSLAGIVLDIDGALLARLPAALAGVDIEAPPLVLADVRIAEPVAQVGKFICIGLNYIDHANEAGMAVPTEPIIFMKATSAIIGPNDDVLLPPGSVKGDWEVELGIVIGREARYVSRDAAMDHVAGLVLVNNLSEREYQLERAANGTRARTVTRSARSAPGW